MTRSHPSHWIWHQTFPTRFEPDDVAYAVMRQLCQETGADALISHIEDYIQEGMSAEQLVALFDLDAHMPPEVVRVYGNGLACWIARYMESRP